MIKWKIRTYILIYIFYLKFVNITCKIENQNNINKIKIEPQKVHIKYLYYSKINSFNFIGKNELNNLWVNFYSIDCDIDVKTNPAKENANITKIKNDVTSIIINKNRIKKVSLEVKPLINSGNNDKNEEFRTCPVVINSLYMDKFEINIEEKESMALSFNENLPYIILLYKIKNLNEDSFVTLSFIVDENISFNIDIKNELNRNISSTSNIFLDYSKLSKIRNDTLTIKIIFNKESISRPKYNATLIFKLIESNSISILRKNILNQGFTISKKVNQYYYLEIVKGEEGEIILHNKRLYGELFGIIKPKLNINPYNKSHYIEQYKYNELQFDPHTLKLSFKSYQTKQCKKGCYLFITYKHYNNDYNNQIVGFEYTLLTRIWDEEEISPQIIDISFNEYIFGYFEDNSINHHYYSLYIPNDTESIIIQYEGKSIVGFIGNGKRKLNTLKILNNTHNLNLTENQMIRQYNINELKELKIYNYISLTFRKKFYFKKIFPIYYFRILLLKKGENNIIYPLDSNIGNFCSPKKEKDKYYCYFLLKNYYNEFSLNYSISTSNNNDKLTYNYFKVINGKIIGKKVNKYISDINNINNASLVKFIFENEKIVNILSTLSIKKHIIYPQIYSLQMYDLRNNTIFSFKINQDLLLTLNYIWGKGIINLSDLKFNENSNFKGKPFFFFLNDTEKNFSFVCDELIIYSRFEEINKIKKITQGETFREVVQAIRFPIYYYIKNEEKEINNLKVHFRIKLPKNQDIIPFFDIDGYIMDENGFYTKRNINDEFIGLNDPIKGSYDSSFKCGFLNINNTIKKGEYILIKIDYYSPKIYDKIIIEIITMLKNDTNYILPINSYIVDSYDSSENKSYKILIDKENLEKKDIMVEFIPDNSKITGL